MDPMAANDKRNALAGMGMRNEQHQRDEQTEARHQGLQHS
jgi:hypothetical protein